MNADLAEFRWRGADRNGTGSQGEVSMEPYALRAWVQDRYTRGWRWLTVRRGSDGVIVARIVRRTARGKRTVWIES